MTTQEPQDLPSFDPNSENGKRCLSAFFAITLGHVFVPKLGEEISAEDTVDKLLAESLTSGSILSGALMALGLMHKQDLERALLEALCGDSKTPSDEAIFHTATIMNQIVDQLPRLDEGLRDMQAQLLKLQTLKSSSS